MLQYAQKAKIHNSKIVTNTGGSHAQLNPSHFQKDSVDFICRSLSNQRMHHYRYLDVSPLALLKTSTSCPCQCSFCYGRSLNCSAYTVRDWIKSLRK